MVKKYPSDNFNSLAPCGANLGDKLDQLKLTFISTHSPRVGRTSPVRMFLTAVLSFQLTRPVWGEPVHRGFATAYQTFQLTRPVWGEPRRILARSSGRQISTHSPRVGRTRNYMEAAIKCINFNSLAPCGANQPPAALMRGSKKFQLTRPVWGEPKLAHNIVLQGKFQLTRPVWGEPSVLIVHYGHLFISTHSPRVGRTLCILTARRSFAISTHSPRVGRTSALSQISTLP